MKAVRLYAQVLVDVAMAPQSGLKLDAILVQLTSFSKLLEESPMFANVIDNPTIGDEDKQKILKELATKVDLSQISTRFLSLLVKRNRFGLLPQIVSEIENIETERKGGVIGELVSAAPIDTATLNGVTEALAKRLKKPVHLKQKTDTSLIAGMRVTVGGVTYDGSVKGKLDKLSSIL